MNDRILRMPEVTEITGLSKATIYRMIKRGSFPNQMQISEGAVGWQQSTLQAWLDGCSK